MLIARLPAASVLTFVMSVTIPLNVGVQVRDSRPATGLKGAGCFTHVAMAFVLACDDDELKCDYLCIGAGTTNPYPKP